MKHLLQNKLLNAIIKILIFGGLLLVLYKQLFSNEKMDATYEHFLLNFHGNYLLLTFSNSFNDSKLGIRGYKMENAD